jgi:hypothetical protein
MCPDCNARDAAIMRAKLEAIKPKLNEEAIKKGLEFYAIVRTVNAKPGFAIREQGSPDIERLGLVEWGIVY